MQISPELGNCNSHPCATTRYLPVSIPVKPQNWVNQMRSSLSPCGTHEFKPPVSSDCPLLHGSTAANLPHCKLPYHFPIGAWSLRISQNNSCHTASTWVHQYTVHKWDGGVPFFWLENWSLPMWGILMCHCWLVDLFGVFQLVYWWYL